MKTIGLVMIVRDEAATVRRCLDSVRPLVDYVLVVDTGSQDGTPEIVRRYLTAAGLRGEVVEEPWQNFGYNRSHSLAQLRARADIDYALIMDADDVLVFDAGFDPAGFKESLDRPYYDFEIRLGPAKIWRPQLLSNKFAFSYKGVLHEFVAGPREAGGVSYASGVHILAGSDGVRWRNPNKNRDDAAILEKALESETDPIICARYTFYLALAYMEAGDKAKALEFFLKRAELDVVKPELALSLHYAARMMDALGYPDMAIIGAYLQAYEADPVRAEPLHGAMSFCRLNDKPHQGYLIGRHAVGMTEPLHGLFVESWIYEYGILEEFSVSAYRSGHYKDCLKALEKIIADGKIPPSALPRIHENARLAEAKLQGQVPTAGAAPHTGKQAATRD